MGREAKRALGHRTCIECGGFLATPSGAAKFCSAECRRSFNNRRMTRGADLYDLFMALRFDRGVASAFHALTLLSRMARLFRAEDERERQGRASWQAPQQVIDRHPYLTACVLSAGKRRD